MGFQVNIYLFINYLWLGELRVFKCLSHWQFLNESNNYIFHIHD